MFPSLYYFIFRNNRITKLLILIILALAVKPPISAQVQQYDNEYGSSLYFESQMLFDNKLIRESELRIIDLIDKFPNNPSYGKAELLRAKIDIISGNYEVSKSTLEQFVEKYPNSPLQSNALLQIALVLVEQQKWEQAQKYFEKALKRIDFEKRMRSDRNFFATLESEALFWQGISIYQQGRYYESIPSFNQLISKLPKSHLVDDSYFAMALVYEKNMEYDSAITNYNIIINQYPYSNSVLSSAIRSANNYILSRRASRALFDLENATSIYGHIQANDSIGKLYEKQTYLNYTIDEISYLKGEAYNIVGNYDQAIAEMTAFLETYSDTKLRSYFLYGIAWNYLNKSRWAEAISYYEQLIVEGNADKKIISLAEFYRAIAIAKSGKIEDAQKELLSLASRSDYPYIGMALLEVAQINYNSENYNEARKNLIRAEKETNSGRISARIHLLLGATYVQLKNYDAALFEFDKVSTIVQNSNILFFPEKKIFSSEILYRRAICYIQMNRYKQAIINLNQFIAEKPKGEKLSEALFWLAESYYRSDLLKNAQETYTNLTEQFPNYRREEVLYGLGWSYFRDKNFKKSIDYFGILTTEFPKSKFSVEALARLGDGFYLEKNYTKASEYYDKAAKLNPKSDEGQYAAYQLCHALYRNNQYSRALSALLDFVGKYPSSSFAPHAVYLMGWIKFSQKEYTDAINNYSYLIEAYPQSNLVPRAYYSIGDTYFNQGNYEKAISFYRKVVELFPSDPLAPEALKSTQYCYVALGRSEEAIALADQYIQSNPNSPVIEEFSFKKAEMFYTGQKFNDAITEYQKFLEKHPNSEFNPEAMFWMARSYQNLNEIDNAIATLKQLAKKYPKSDYAPRAMIEAAQLLRDRTFLMEADSIYQSVINNYPNTDFAAQSIYRRGDISLAFGDTLRTLDFYREVADKYPTNPYGLSARYRLGMYYRNTGKTDLALKEFEVLASLSEDSELAAESQYRVGELYLKLMKYDDAINAFNVVKDKYSTIEVWFPLSLLSLGETYEKKEDFAKAIDTYKGLIAINPDDDYSKTARTRLKNLTKKLER